MSKNEPTLGMYPVRIEMDNQHIIANRCNRGNVENYRRENGILTDIEIKLPSKVRAFFYEGKIIAISEKYPYVDSFFGTKLRRINRKPEERDFGLKDIFVNDLRDYVSKGRFIPFRKDKVFGAFKELFYYPKSIGLPKNIRKSLAELFE